MPTFVFVELAIIFLLYTYGVFGARRRLAKRYLAALVIGIVLDCHASFIMAGLGAGGWTAHVILGWVALFAMLSFTAATIALRSYPFFGTTPPHLPGYIKISFSLYRFGMMAYVLWLLSLVSGYTAHVAATNPAITTIGG